jgi:hypothetical protein
MAIQPSLEWIRSSVLEGAWQIHEHMRTFELTRDHSIRILAATYSDSGYDFDTACAALETVEVPASDKAQLFLKVIEKVLLSQRPPALALLLQGRLPFVEALGEDAAVCMERCGVLDNPPSPEIVAWLDSLADVARAEDGNSLLERGRAAERLSFEFERSRLLPLDAQDAVVWVSLDDNSAGYDIRSRDRVANELVPKLIEVKACAGPKLEFYLTRNEWLTAQRSPDVYMLHLWDLRTGALTEVRWIDVLPHIPVDFGAGMWTQARIVWSKSA